VLVQQAPVHLWGVAYIDALLCSRAAPAQTSAQLLKCWCWCSEHGCTERELRWQAHSLAHWLLLCLDERAAVEMAVLVLVR
jgi:hypothetical protein